uniref:Uncharacterized protein n=1 Tax=Glossina palpalis gambiensis TaxID=67801 RepID=A0A1B0B2X9_9MUSC
MEIAIARATASRQIKCTVSQIESELKKGMNDKFGNKVTTTKTTAKRRVCNSSNLTTIYIFITYSSLFSWYCLRMAAYLPTRIRQLPAKARETRAVRLLTSSMALSSQKTHRKCDFFMEDILRGVRHLPSDQFRLDMYAHPT